jgi:Zn-dependent protease
MKHLLGSIRLFRVGGITLYLHWSWLIVAYYEVVYGRSRYDSRVWSLAEYLTLFAIILLHEFGHALACRQVGGKADRIMLWPLGGVAFVQPPPRPGAQLWSIAAGPLVNLILVPVTLALIAPQRMADLIPWHAAADSERFLRSIFLINITLLIFNLLPIYPLDGGQILRSLLWFVMGASRSLLVVSVVGLIGGIGLVALALWLGSTWGIIMALFIGWRSIAGFRNGLRLGRWLKAEEKRKEALARFEQGDLDAAIQACTACLDTAPNENALCGEVYYWRGVARAARGDASGARDDLEASLIAYPDSLAALDYLGTLLATSTRDEVRNGARAMQLATRACELTEWNEPSYMETLAAAYAELGLFDEAIAVQQRALKSANSEHDGDNDALKRLEMYTAGKPLRGEL